jgi:hypothetical protein
MQIDPVEEWQRLTEHYRTLTDDQLEELADDFADLTEAAQQILRGAMRSRGLRDPLAPPNPQRKVDISPAPPDEDDAQSAASDSDGGSRYEYTWKTLLRECSTREEAWQVSELLRRAGIESWIDGPGIYSPYAELDLTSPRVLVAADELDRAREIAARPIPQDIVDASKETLPEFEPPKCPRCGAADPALESADPVNAWRCELCARRWTEGEAKPDAKSDLAPQRTLP